MMTLNLRAVNLPVTESLDASFGSTLPTEPNQLPLFGLETTACGSLSRATSYNGG
jgi:hypothetical protein